MASAKEVTCDLYLKLMKKQPPHFKLPDLKDFAALKSNRERVDLALEHLEKYSALPKFVRDEKDDESSIGDREQGNELFKNGNYKSALVCYNVCIMEAKSKTTLAIGYANRSAALFRLNLHEECIIDIERALANNYPEKLKPKLLKRLAESRKLRTPPKRFHREIPEIPDCEKNPQIQCAKNCIEIQDTKEFGKHVAATRNIQIGEVICVEKPYASMLLTKPLKDPTRLNIQDPRLNHCYDCMELCYNLIPCENCTEALFCSESCKEKVQKSYHKYECPILKSLNLCGLNQAGLALKVALLSKDYYNESAAFKITDVYRSDRYKEIHHLKSAIESRPLDALYRNAVISAVAFHLLSNTDFFSGPDPERLKQNFKDVMLTQFSTFNALGSGETHKTDESSEPFSAGLYSFASLFNHSCCPNVYHGFYGSTIVHRAVNTIKKGQQCFISYGPRYDNSLRKDRQSELARKYYFHCTCKACKGNWMPARNSLGAKLEPGIADPEIQMPFLMAKLKKCEESEPRGNAAKLKKMIRLYYESLGNKLLL